LPCTTGSIYLIFYLVKIPNGKIPVVEIPVVEIPVGRATTRDCPYSVTFFELAVI